MDATPIIHAQWFFGRVTSLTAQLYVRVRGTDPTHVTLSPLSPRGRATGAAGPAPLLTIHVTKATLTGPRSLYARTLETSVQLTPVAGDETLWQATLEDPCFWTLRQPYLYAARLTIAVANGQQEEILLTLGVPVLMVRDNRLELEQKNWTLRAFRPRGDLASVLANCHESGTGLLVDCPSDALCEMASREGTLLVADFSQVTAERVEGELRRVARWPAVGLAILPDQAEVDRVLRQETSHVIRAQKWPSAQAAKPRDWAQVLIVPPDATGDPLRTLSVDHAIVVSSGANVAHVTGNTLSEDAATQVALGRQACDSLQAELAGRGDFAGYLVG